MADPKKRILVVDDHPIVRQGLVELISGEPDLAVCGEAPDVPTALEAMTEADPDVVILDLALRVGDAIELIQRIRAERPGVSVLVLTMHDESFFAERALRAGAMGYLTKQDASEEVLVAVRSLLDGQMYVSDRLSPKLLKRLLSGPPLGDRSVVERLSERELQVFELIGGGMSSQEIAEALQLSVKTVESYSAHIKDKLDLRDARELVQYAIRWALRRRIPDD